VRAKQASCYVSRIAVFFLSVTQTSFAQTLPTFEQFDGALRTCASGQNIALNADVIGSISSIYKGERTQGAASFKSSTEFLKLMPEDARLGLSRLLLN
jgi:hypothetical protein